MITTLSYHIDQRARHSDVQRHLKRLSEKFSEARQNEGHSFGRDQEGLIEITLDASNGQEGDIKFRFVAFVRDTH